MERNNLIKQLNSLGQTKAGGQPREAWVRDTRAVLMEKAVEHIANMPAKGAEVRQLRFALDVSASWQRMMRPALATAAIVALLFGGSIATVSASYGSLPGDTLYPVKIFTEGAQLSFTAGRENKTKMRMDFAGRRLDEVAKLVETTRPEKEKRIVEAVSRFKNDIAAVNKDLDSIKQQKDTKKAVEVAKDVDRKAEEYGEAIKKAINKVPADSKQDVKKAKAVVEEVGVKAVEVLVEKHMSGETTDVTEEEIIEKINKKIQQAEESIAEVDAGETAAVEEADAQTEAEGDEVALEEEADEQTEGDAEETTAEEAAASVQATATSTTQAKENLANAKTLLDNKDLLGAVGAVKEATTLASAAGEASAQPTAASTDVPVVTGEATAATTTVESASGTESVLDEEATTTEEIIN